jgi:hypothetical protein
LIKNDKKLDFMSLFLYNTNKIWGITTSSLSTTQSPPQAPIQNIVLDGKYTYSSIFKLGTLSATTWYSGTTAITADTFKNNGYPLLFDTANSYIFVCKPGDDNIYRFDCSGTHTITYSYAISSSTDEKVKNYSCTTNKSYYLLGVSSQDSTTPGYTCSSIWINPNSEKLYSEVLGCNDIDIANDAIITNDLSVKNSVTITYHLSVGDYIWASKNISTSAAVNVGTSLNVTGVSNLNGGAAVGTTSSNKNLIVHGSTTVDSNLTVGGYANVSGNLTVTGYTTVKGNTTLGDSTSDKIQVEGYENISSNLTVGGYVTTKKSSYTYGMAYAYNGSGTCYILPNSSGSSGEYGPVNHIKVVSSLPSDASSHKDTLYIVI